MYNQPFYQNPNVMGFTNPNRPQARYTQPVTNEMSKMVLSSDDELSVKIGPIDKIKNMCTHKFPGTQQLALVECPNSGDPTLVQCRVCGERFHMVENPESANIKAVCDQLIDVMQSAKTMYLDMPEEFAKEFFQIITLVKRVPQLFDKAANNFSQYEVSPNAMTVYNGMNSFQQVGNVIGGYNMGGIMPNPGYAPGYAPNYAPQYAPQYAAPAQQPVYAQQWTTNEYGQPVPVMVPQENPLMYNAPAAPVAPAPVAPAPAPAAGVAPAAPAAQTGEVTQVKAFSV